MSDTYSANANWESVPKLVKLRYKRAAAVAKLLEPFDCAAFWHPTRRHVLVKLANSELMPPTKLPGLSVEFVSWLPEDQADYIQVKTASALGWLNAPYDWAGRLGGGPSPVSNGIVSALLGAGGGYALGKGLEAVLPEQYFDTRKLGKRLAVAGAAGGAALAIPQAAARLSLNQKYDKNYHWLPSLFQGIEQQPFAKNLAKQASLSGWEGMNEPIPVDRFNRAIWNDTFNGQHSSNSTAAATTAAMASGLVTGIQQMYGNTPILTPRHFVTGLMAAGTDLITANVVGRTLGALGILTPAAQSKVQEMGLWGGMMRGVTQSIFGR